MYLHRERYHDVMNPVLYVCMVTMVTILYNVLLIIHTNIIF